MELYLCAMPACFLLGLFLGIWAVEINLKRWLEIPDGILVSDFVKALAPYVTLEIRYSIKESLRENK